MRENMSKEIIHRHITVKWLRTKHNKKNLWMSQKKLTREPQGNDLSGASLLTRNEVRMNIFKSRTKTVNPDFSMHQKYSSRTQLLSYRRTCADLHNDCCRCKPWSSGRKEECCEWQIEASSPEFLSSTSDCSEQSIPLQSLQHRWI